MPNPFGYGDTLGFTNQQIGNAGLIPTTWLDEALRLAMPSVYFPNVTPSMTELQRGNSQAVVVPLEGEMTDTSWPSLVEGTSITVGSYNLDALSVTIIEAGRGLETSRFIRQFLANGLYPGEAQRWINKLMNNVLLSWENELRDGIYMNTQFGILSVAAGSQTGIIDVTTAQTAPIGTIRQEIVDDVLNEFRTVHVGTLGTFVIPPFEDGLYRMVGNYSTIRGFFSDDDWKTLQTRNQTIGGQGLIIRDIGEFAGFRWIEHALMPTGTLLAHGRDVAIQAWGGIFDDDIPPENVVELTDSIIPVQIRFENNWQNDFFRRKAAAWYTVAGSAAALRDIGTHAIRVFVAT